MEYSPSRHAMVQIYGGPPEAKRHLDLETLSPSELYRVNELTGTWRERLYNIIWFMSRLNQSIVCQSNAEDKYRGRFWEDRYNR